MLQSVPSLSVFAVVEDGGDAEEHAEAAGDGLRRADGDRIDAATSGDFSFPTGHVNMDFIKEDKEEEEDDDDDNLSLRSEVEPPSPPMYLAAGLGIDSVDFGKSLELVVPKFDSDEDMEDYFKRMVDDFPCQPLFLRKYAQILQSKGDLDGAEDYFSRASLVDLDNAELLIEYAQFIWEVRHDRERALSYFERATQVSPQDSNVLAAYARFVWEVDSDNEGNGSIQSPRKVKEQDEQNLLEAKDGMESQQLSLSVDPIACSTEEDYIKMLERDPQNASILRNYAWFLYQSKGDHQAAEDMYSRATEADPANGEALAMYATLVWQLHHDFHKASSLFERAVQASAQDSQVLGAYACFVWETDDQEEDHVP